MEQLGRLIDTSIASRDPDDFLDGLDDVRSAAEPLEIERSRTAKTRNSYNVLNSSFSRSASSFGTVGSGEALRESLPQLGIRDFGLCVCACCKKIRDDKGYWNQVAAYIPAHSEVEFSHSLCPECLQNLYPNLKREEMSPYQQAGDQLRALKPL